MISDSGGSFSHVACHVGGADWRVLCTAYPDTTPILSLDAGSSAVSVTTRGKLADAAAFEFARALAREAQRFADEIERMHAAQPGGNGKAADRDAA